MSSHSSDPNPAQPERGREIQREIDETDYVDALSKTDETSAFHSDTKPPSNKSSSPKKQPRQVGGYEIGDMLGQGGMGRVFRADDSSGRSIALKLLSPDLARSPDALARFKQEGLIASQINHPHCVFVHRVDNDGGTPFIAMELMTGQTLKDLVLKNGPRPYLEAVQLILQCVDGLIAAHSLGMIHRDIKPANCYLDDDGNVKIGDFGLARSLVSDSELTQTGAFLGTPLFASPEQLLGQTVDARSDIYSLSATLYYLLAGKAPFESPNAAQVIARIASSDPPSFKSVGVEVPAALEQIVMKGLSRDASKRYASFVDMRNDLQAIIKPKDEPTSLTRRSFAWLIDYFFITSLIAALMFSVASLKQLQEMSMLSHLFSMAVVFLYYLLTESIFAATLGKAALRVKVVDARTGGRANIVRILLRAAFTILVSSFVFIPVKLAFPNLTPLIEGLLIAATFVLNIAILGSTWWHTRKRQLANDWISGTECRTPIGLRATVRTAIALPTWELPVKPVLSPDAAVPASLGRFEIEQEIDCQPLASNVRWFIGLDKQLERAIWIALSNDPAISFEKLQNKKPKSTRLRFIEEGSTPEGRWFAFVAPDGIPLIECAKQGIQLPWPITRSVLEQIAAVADANSIENTNSLIAPQKESDAFRDLDASRLWIDSSGRLTDIDFRCSSDLSTDIVSLVCKLGLPRRHRLRKTFKAASSTRDLLPIEALPPLRAVQMMERMGTSVRSPSPSALKQILENLDKQSHELTPRSRFVSAAASLGLMSPLIFVGIVMLIVPSVILIVDGLYKEIRKLNSLAVYADQPELFTEIWRFASQEQKDRWTSSSGRVEIQEALELQSDRMQRALSNVGSFEKMIITNIPKIDLESPPIYGNKSASSIKLDEVTETEEEASGESSERIKINAGPMSVVEMNFGQEQMDAELAQSILASVEQSKKPFQSDEKFPDFLVVSIGMGVCMLWTALTYGGITKYLTGISYMRRDGKRMGIIRSVWRAIILYAPLLLVAYLISYCNTQGYEYLWWGTIFKRVFCILLIAYLATTLIWYRRTPLDVLAGTVAVPR